MSRLNCELCSVRLPAWWPEGTPHCESAGLAEHPKALRLTDAAKEAYANA